MLKIKLLVNGKEIRSLSVVNDGTGTNTEANYVVRHNNGSFFVRGHNRNRGAWVLAERVIHKYLTGEDIPDERLKH